MKSTVLTIKGMGCSGCVNAVENALAELSGVENTIVNLDKGTAEVEYDDSKVKASDFKQAVEDAGYQMTGIQP